MHSATAELAPLRFQWINFIKNFSEGNHSDTSGETAQLYHMFSCLTYTDYLRVSSSWDAAFLIKCTFCWNPINCPLGERRCFPLDWCDLRGCLSLFASGTTKGKIMPLYEGKLGHGKATSFLVLRGRIYSLATISSSSKGWRMLGGLFSNLQAIMLKLLSCNYESACFFSHPGNFPPRTVDRFSHNSVNIHWPRLWKIYRSELAFKMTTTTARCHFPAIYANINL